MQSPITIHVPEEFSANMIVSAEYPPACQYKIPFATPSFTKCSFGSFLLQSARGKDYWMELWAFTAKKKGFLNLIINRPYVSIALFLKGSLSGQLLGNGFVHVPARSFNIFYLPVGVQKMDLSKGDYVLLFIIPPKHYLQTMVTEHPGVKDILNRLATGASSGDLLTNFPLPREAWRVIKRLEKTGKKGAALDITLRRYILELLGLYFDQYKQYGTKSFSYNTSEEKAIAVRNYILENLDDSNLGGLNELAERFYLSRQTLAKKFKDVTGRTIPQFISDERLKWAKALLDKKEMKVFEIALIAGFSDTANFIRAFKKKYGCSPGKQNH